MLGFGAILGIHEAAIKRPGSKRRTEMDDCTPRITQVREMLKGVTDAEMVKEFKARVRTIEKKSVRGFGDLGDLMYMIEKIKALKP